MKHSKVIYKQRQHLFPWNTGNISVYFLLGLNFVNMYKCNFIFSSATQCVGEEFLLWNLHPTLTSNLYRNFGVKILYESRVTTWVPQKRHNMNIFTEINNLASLPIYLQILVSLSRTNPQIPLVGHNSDTMCQGRIFTLESTSYTH